DASQTKAVRFGWDNRVPFLVRTLPGGVSSKSQSWEKSIIGGWPENVILVSSTPNKDGNSSVLHVRETEGKSADVKSLKLSNKKQSSFMEVNVLGEELDSPSTILKPFEAKFFKLSW
ncbi:MAG TPA: hypothetical protein VLZ33_06060, partial [Dysgonamonadaceae bacterium]|nr:hypothetical protein [Dysgonamonadaceae bacterium]